MLLLLGTPAFAEEGDTNQTAIANPTAVSSGSAVNQAVQVVNTQYFQQHYGGGVSCQGTTLVVAPFVLGGMSAPESNVRNDFGLTLQVSIPLDREAVDSCKRRAAAATARSIAETDKAQLDYQMVRALKCAELIGMGAFLNPSSPYSGLCADVVARDPSGVLRTGTGALVATASPQGTPSPSSSGSSGSPSSQEASQSSGPDQTGVSQKPQLPSLQSLPPQQSSQQLSQPQV